MRHVIATLTIVAMAAACGSSKEQTKKGKPAKEAAAAGDGAGSGGAVQVRADGNTQIKRIDLNDDKKADVYKFYRVLGGNPADKDAKKVLVRKEMDVNFDQRFDIVQYFTGEPGKEILIREEMDLDFDGRVDSTRHYKDGHVQRVELDLGFDGKIDTWRYYQLTKNDEGKTLNRLIEKRRDKDGDGAVDVWEYFTKGRLTKIGYDTTGDGSPDRFKKIGRK
jgi:hypothetical protein